MVCCLLANICGYRKREASNSRTKYASGHKMNIMWLFKFTDFLLRDAKTTECGGRSWPDHGHKKSTYVFHKNISDNNKLCDISRTR